MVSDFIDLKTRKLNSVKKKYLFDVKHLSHIIKKQIRWSGGFQFLINSLFYLFSEDKSSITNKEPVYAQAKLERCYLLFTDRDFTPSYRDGKGRYASRACT